MSPNFAHHWAEHRTKLPSIPMTTSWKNCASHFTGGKAEGGGGYCIFSSSFLSHSVLLPQGERPWACKTCGWSVVQPPASMGLVERGRARKGERCSPPCAASCLLPRCAVLALASGHLHLSGKGAELFIDLLISVFGIRPTTELQPQPFLFETV